MMMLNSSSSSSSSPSLLRCFCTSLRVLMPPLPPLARRTLACAEAAGRLLGDDVRRGQDGGAQRGEHRVHDPLVRAPLAITREVVCPLLLTVVSPPLQVRRLLDVHAGDHARFRSISMSMWCHPSPSPSIHLIATRCSRSSRAATPPHPCDCYAAQERLRHGAHRRGGAGHRGLDAHPAQVLRAPPRPRATCRWSCPSHHSGMPPPRSPLRYACRRLILVGDPNQLPATVFSEPAVEHNYEQSLFQRLQVMMPPPPPRPFGCLRPSLRAVALPAAAGDDAPPSHPRPFGCLRPCL